jgi:hypothetical protein
LSIIVSRMQGWNLPCSLRSDEEYLHPKPLESNQL